MKSSYLYMFMKNLQLIYNQTLISLLNEYIKCIFSVERETFSLWDTGDNLNHRHTRNRTVTHCLSGEHKTALSAIMTTRLHLPSACLSIWVFVHNCASIRAPLLKARVGEGIFATPVSPHIHLPFQGHTL